MTEEEFAKLEMEDISGFYEFKNDIENPHGDKRKKREAYAPVITKGTKITLERHMIRPKVYNYTMYFKDGSFWMTNIEELSTILARLDKTEPTHKEVLSSCGYALISIVESLIAMGKISVADLQEAIKHLENQTEDGE